MNYSELNIEERFKICVESLEKNGHIANKKEVADKLGYTKQSISEIFAGRMKLNPYKLRDFCILYSISPEWLLMGTGEMERDNRNGKNIHISNTHNGVGDNINQLSDCEHEVKLLSSKLEEAQKLLQEKEERIRDLKEVIAVLKTK